MWVNWYGHVLYPVNYLVNYIKRLRSDKFFFPNVSDKRNTEKLEIYRRIQTKYIIRIDIIHVICVIRVST